MNPTNKLHRIGQSLWLDNITRDLLRSGVLKRYVDEFSITGLTSEPDDLRPRHQEQHATTTTRSAAGCGTAVGRGALLRARA